MRSCVHNNAKHRCLDMINTLWKVPQSRHLASTVWIMIWKKVTWKPVDEWVSLSQIWPPKPSLSFTSLLDINGGHFLLNNYLLSTSCILGPENTCSSDTLGVPSILMKFILSHGLLHQPSDWFSCFQFLLLKSIPYLLLVWTIQNTNHVMLIHFQKPSRVFFTYRIKFPVYRYDSRNLHQLFPADHCCFISNLFSHHSSHWATCLSLISCPILSVVLPLQITYYETELGFAVPLKQCSLLILSLLNIFCYINRSRVSRIRKKEDPALPSPHWTLESTSGAFIVNLMLIEQRAESD